MPETPTESTPRKTPGSTTDPTATAFESAIATVREFNEHTLAESKKASSIVLDAHESALKAIAAYTEKLGAANPIEPVATITKTQADLARELTTAYTKALRSLLA